MHFLLVHSRRDAKSSSSFLDTAKVITATKKMCKISKRKRPAIDRKVITRYEVFEQFEMTGVATASVSLLRSLHKAKNVVRVENKYLFYDLLFILNDSTRHHLKVDASQYYICMYIVTKGDIDHSLNTSELFKYI